MRRQHPNHKMDIPVSLEVWQQLLGASINTGYEKEDWEIAAEAIDEWMRRHNPDAFPMPAVSGYQWKSQFLPDGTVLRTVFNGKNYHCLVEGDRILYNGKEVSPSGFVNAVGGIRRNAWRCTWILLPDAKDWKLADTLRARVRPPRVTQSTVSQTIDSASVSDGPSLQHPIDEQAPPASLTRETRTRTAHCARDHQLRGVAPAPAQE
ncbi:MAG: hypothetical protein V4631_20600 [Pseudomonadota bacterium]